MIRAVDQSDLYINYRISGKYTIVERFLYSFVYGRNVLPRHHAALYGINEFITGSGLLRLHLKPDMSILAAPTGLGDKLAFYLYFFGNGFAIRNLRFADVGLNLELAHHTIDDDFKVK